MIALLSGSFALASRKGAGLHRQSGKIFVVSMALSTGVGAIIAAAKPELVTVISGLLTIYLIATSWMSLHRLRSERLTLSAAFIAAISIALWSCWGGVAAVQSVDGLKDGFPPVPYFTFAALAVFAGITDLTYMRSAKLYKHRLARHIWRMCIAFLIAASALLLGQMQVFPEVIRSESILSIPLLIILALMIFYLFQTYRDKRKAISTPKSPEL